MPRKKSPDHNQFLFIKRAGGTIAKGISEPLAETDPAAVSLRLKPGKKPGETYVLKLTRQQRETLIHCTRIRNKLKEKLQAAGEGTQFVNVTRKELDHLNDEIGQAALYASGPDKKRLVVVLHHVADLFAEGNVGIPGEKTLQLRKAAPKKSKLLYQFKIKLLDIKPAIWRRIQVPDGTLADLHEYLQTAFGWSNCHMHQFEIDGERYGLLASLDFGFGDDLQDETEVRLSELIPKSGRKSRWIYEYDFGDGWRHEVLFEGFPSADPNAKYPLCLEGERACPPEDCGGPWGYIDYLAAIADPKHEQHEEMLEWGGPFDPETFDAKRATREMRNLK